MKQILMGLILLISISACDEKASDEPRQSAGSDSAQAISRLESMGDFYFNKKDYNKAVRYFDTLISLNPKSGMFFFKRGDSYTMLLERLKAVEDYNMLLHYIIGLLMPGITQE